MTRKHHLAIQPPQSHDGGKIVSHHNSADRVYTMNTHSGEPSRNWDLSGGHPPMFNQNQPGHRTHTQSTYASRLLHPVGLAMPSQTVHFTEELYRYLITTKTEEQSMSDRVRELVEAGRETEEDT